MKLLLHRTAVSRVDKGASCPEQHLRERIRELLASKQLIGGWKMSVHFPGTGNRRCQKMVTVSEQI
jgi:hypothetical protein